MEALPAGAVTNLDPQNFGSTVVLFMNLDKLMTESRNPASLEIHDLSALDLALLMITEEAQVLPAIRFEVSKIAQAIELISDRLRSGGRLIFLGAGTSGRVGALVATDCQTVFGTSAELVQAVIAGGPSALSSIGQKSKITRNKPRSISNKLA